MIVGLNDLFGDIMNAAYRTLSPYADDVVKEMRRLAQAYVRQLKKIESATSRKHCGQFHSRVHAMMTSPGNKVVAMILAYPKCGKKRPKVSLAKIKARARELDMYHSTGEMVTIKPIAKSDGQSFRTTGKFGVRSRAGQRLALDTMRAIWGESKFEFARKGRGRDRMVEHIAKGINNRRSAWVAEADLKDFFPSIDRREVVRTVPLPRSVIRHHVLVSEDTEIFLIGNTEGVSEITARAGLMQGSLNAPYVASKMLEPLLDLSVGKDGCSYIDNINTWGSSEDEVQTKMDTLASTVSKHPAGRYHLKYQRSLPVGSKEIDTVGYRFRRDAVRWGGRTRALPSVRAITDQERKLITWLVLVGENHHEKLITTWATDWPARYPQWQGRHSCSDIAEILAMTNLVPFAKIVRRQIARSQRSFRSFGDLQLFVRRLARHHQPEPDWTAIENNPKILGCVTITETRVSSWVRAAPSPS